MEIKPKMTMCPEGHYYNAAKHSSCPLCKEESAGSVMGTAMPEESVGSFSPTIAPEVESVNIGSFSPTIAPDFDPFDVPTEIGGDVDSCVNGPVVGWLVCIEGVNRGRDYRIHAGYNYIGRETGDIAIMGDMQISRQNHAMIAFDESEGAFFVGPSAGRNLIKVNGKAVISPVDLNSFDVISIGSTKLLFVALCGEKFSWNKELVNA